MWFTRVISGAVAVAEFKTEQHPHLTDRGAHRWLQRLLLVVPLVVFAVLAWTHRTVIDDGFIYMRVVHQVTAGHGPVFNVGERVEVFTSPLWLGVLSVGDVLTPVRLEWLAVILGIGATLGGLALTMVGATRLMRQADSEALVVPFGVVVLVALAPMWVYASSGLETGVTFLWLGASLWVLAEWSATDDRVGGWRAVALGLGWLVRPELLVYSVAFLALVLALQWRRDSWRVRVRFLAVALALPAAYQVFRMGYYGSLVANTAVAKEGTQVRWHRGWLYLVDFVKPYWFLGAMAVVVAGGYLPAARRFRNLGCRRAVWLMAAFVSVGLANVGYVVAVGGDYMHARLVLPAVFALCAPVAMVPMTRHHIGALGLIPWVVGAAFVMRPPPFVLGTSFMSPNLAQVTTDDLGWGGGSRKVTEVGDSGLYFEKLPFTRFYPVDVPLRSSVRQPVAAIFAVGVVSYAVGDRLYVLDLYGLGDSFAARIEAPALEGPDSVSGSREAIARTLDSRPVGSRRRLGRPHLLAHLSAGTVAVDSVTHPEDEGGRFAAPSRNRTRRPRVRTSSPARAKRQCADVDWPFLPQHDRLVREHPTADPSRPRGGVRQALR